MSNIAPSAAQGEARRKTRGLTIVGVAIVAGLLFVLLANFHLVYVAVTSQPECVAHIKADAAPAPAGSFSAAKSAC